MPDLLFPIYWMIRGWEAFSWDWRHILRRSQNQRENGGNIMQKLRKALSVSLAVGVLATACSVFSAPAAADGGQVTTPYFHGLDENTD